MPSNHYKIALFIDGANLHAATRALGFDVDYKRLLNEFKRRGMLLRAFYYAAVGDDQEYSTLRPLINWLEYNEYTVVTQRVRECADPSRRHSARIGTDIHLTVDAMELSERVDEIILFSGDGELRPLVQALQRRGVRVTVVSSIASQPPMIADELRRQADAFADLVELQPIVSRQGSERFRPREAPQKLPTSRRPPADLRFELVAGGEA